MARRGGLRGPAAHLHRSDERKRERARIIDPIAVGKVRLAIDGDPDHVAGVEGVGALGVHQIALGPAVDCASGKGNQKQKKQ